MPRAPGRAPTSPERAPWEPLHRHAFQAPSLAPAPGLLPPPPGPGCPLPAQSQLGRLHRHCHAWASSSSSSPPAGPGGHGRGAGRLRRGLPEEVPSPLPGPALCPPGGSPGLLGLRAVRAAPAGAQRKGNQHLGIQKLLHRAGSAARCCGSREANGQVKRVSTKRTDVFICTSPIKKYRYCPYEKELSRAPAGSTSSSRPATTSTWSSQLLFGGSTRGPMIGSPSWTASAFRRAGLVPTAASPGGPLVNLGQWVPSGNAEKGVQFQTWKPRVDLAGSKQEAMRKPRPKTCGLSLC
ncbi:5'(3')-deoxyribonucleotidase, mitochondrial isoform X1 [Tiliqua scincoides]|uniref:5'(3')-deoxyribonucleotidase, mitochondrial isoform X1 n=1 Tax=Tiliqua scincoides TaxID=71010 RepID=UPI0034621DF4